MNGRSCSEATNKWCFHPECYTWRVLGDLGGVGVKRCPSVAFDLSLRDSGLPEQSWACQVARCMTLSSGLRSTSTVGVDSQILISPSAL